ncbi:Peptidoglycan-binding domain 1 protein [Haliangium ochraceum DSM 14365]|uniref:Peptidoglycan-binding domain 1 protein n=2 Tax=Haliangium ochraceum TaxID=80816 RepID=D0LVV9_HALO1|nr:Peptidoglycan-binding domain 1 protein [Haliangium ochraceum DSM 14365]
METESDQTPELGGVFSLIAYIFFHLRHALEDVEEMGRPPRFARIARAAPEKDEFLGAIVSKVANGVAETISLVAHLTLELEKGLTQADAIGASIGVVAQMLDAVAKPEFQNGVQELIGSSKADEIQNAAATIKNLSDNAKQFEAIIPGPEDLKSLGHELYRLLCIVQKPLPRRSSEDRVDAENPDLQGPDHVSMLETGKARLMAWAYAHGVETYALGTPPQNKELSKLGSRRLFETINNSGLPSHSTLVWGSGEDRVTIFQFTYGANGNDDIRELVQVLQMHGYNQPTMSEQSTTLTPQIRENLMRFQAINELPITGNLDNLTLNRLHHLDFARKNLRSAKPYDANYPWPWESDPTQLSGPLKVVNPGGDHPADVGISPISNKPLRYYLIPTAPANADHWAQGSGWIRDASGPVGFAAVQSRPRNAYQQDGSGGRYPGNLWSEGEAGHGDYFFAARLSEPWVDGRSGEPNPDSLAPTPPAMGTVSRMYQWIVLPSWLMTPPGPEMTLYVYASALQRSLYTNRDESGKPDQGRLSIEAFADDGFAQGPVTIRDASRRRQFQTTEWFPDQTVTTAGMSLDQVDRNRLWILRKTEPLAVPAETAALCLVAEGQHQAGYDTDAYFDDFQVHYYWASSAS